MTRKAVAIRHVPFEDLGAFVPELKARDFAVEYVDAGVGAIDSAAVRDADVLFILGGPIGAYEEELYPFLTDELRVIEERLAQNRPLVGICLGAQLIARSLGAKVYPGPSKEIGFAPIMLTAAGEESCLEEYGSGNVLHWHGDTFDLPPNSTLLASTAVCKHQAFSHGDHTIAFQFHPEAAAEQFETWLIAHTAELRAAGADIPKIRHDWHEQRQNLQAKARRCIGRWLDTQGF